MPFFVQNGYPVFTNDDGLPLENGYVFIGVQNLNPLSNPQQAFWDENLTIVATNIRTRGGYAVFNGSPGQIFTENAFSLLVQNEDRETIYFNPDASSIETGPIDQDLSGIANGYLPVGFVTEQNGFVYPGFIEDGTNAISAGAFPELFSLVNSLDYLEDNGNGTFNILPFGLDTGWVINSDWQGVTFTIIHNLGKVLTELDVVFEVSSLGTDAMAIRLLDSSFDIAAATTSGVVAYADTTDRFLLRTGNIGIDIIDTDGSRLLLNTQSWFYRVTVKRRDLPFPGQVKAQVLQNQDALTTLKRESGWIANSDWTNVSFTFAHSLDELQPFVEFWVSTDGTFENSFRIGFATDEDNAKGVTLFIRDENTIAIQTGTNGILVTADNATITGTQGAPVTLAAQAWFYNIVVYKPQLVTNISETTENAVQIISLPGSAVNLSPSADVGNSVEYIIKPSAPGVTINPPAGNSIIRGLRDRTEPGTSGKFNTRPNQALRLTKIGNALLYDESFDKVTDPAALPINTGLSCAWSSDRRYLAVGFVGSPTIAIYDWISGSPVKITDPAILPNGNGTGVAWSPDARYLAVATSLSPFVTIYDWDTGVPIKIADPAVLPTGTGLGCTWSPDGRYLVVTHQVSPFVTIYDWDSGTPVKVTNPAALPTGDGQGCRWSPDNRYLSIAHTTSPFITIYDWTTGSPVKITNPAVLPPATGFECDWSSDSRYLVVGHSSNPFITIYDWISGDPVKITNPATLPPGNGTGVAWSPDGEYLAVAHTTSPFVTIYDQATSGALIKVANPSVLPTGNGQSSTWSPDGRYLVVAHGTSPFITIYDTVSLVGNCWQIQLVDGPEIRSGDFGSIT